MPRLRRPLPARAVIGNNVEDYSRRAFEGWCCNWFFIGYRDGARRREKVTSKRIGNTPRWFPYITDARNEIGCSALPGRGLLAQLAQQLQSPPHAPLPQQLPLTFRDSGRRVIGTLSCVRGGLLYWHTRAMPKLGLPYCPHCPKCCDNFLTIRSCSLTGCMTCSWGRKGLQGIASERILFR